VVNKLSASIKSALELLETKTALTAPAWNYVTWQRRWTR
jgi:hypothetical protein